MAAVNPRSFCRVSPNEEAHLRHMNMEERRKARLVQVREQEKHFARQVRERVRDKRETERRVLKEHVNAALADAHETELRELESKYLSRVDSVGQGHRDAQQINEEENRLQELRLLLEAKQRWRAQDRHAAAMKELSANQLKEKQQKEQSLQIRKQALEVEKERAKLICSADPPSNQMIMDFEVEPSHRVQFKEAEDFSTSYYHIPNPVVERMGTPDSTELNAQEQARLQIEEDRNIEKSAAAIKQEHSEMARLRYKYAWAKVKLEKDNTAMLKQLESLEREDRAQRQKSLSKMPANMFQPVDRRIEMASEQQREMEGAFERLFVKTKGSFPRHSFAEPCPPTPSDCTSTGHTPNDHESHLTELEPLTYNHNRTAQESPRATPDSGIHGELSARTEDNSGKTDTTLSVNPASSMTGHSSTETSHLSGSLIHDGTSKVTGLMRRHPLYTSSSASDESKENTRSQPLPASHHRSLKSGAAWTLSHDIQSSTDTSEELEGPMTKTMFTQTKRPHPSDYLVSTIPPLERPQLTATDVPSSDDQSTEMENRLHKQPERLGGESSTSASSHPFKRGEGMKTLLSMIHSQQQTWNEQMRNRHKSTPSISPSHPVTVSSVSSYLLPSHPVIVSSVPPRLSPSRPVIVSSVPPCLSPSHPVTISPSVSPRLSPSHPVIVSAVPPRLSPSRPVIVSSVPPRLSPSHPVTISPSVSPRLSPSRPVIVSSVSPRLSPSPPVIVSSVSPRLSPSPPVTISPSVSPRLLPSRPTDAPNDTNDRVVLGEQQPDTLSIYTLSTRESTMSPEFSLTPHQLPSVNDMLQCPDLSISPYNTTLETSVLPTRSENSRTVSEPRHPASIVTQLAGTISGPTPLDVSIRASEPSEQVETTSSLALSFHQTSHPPGNTTVHTSSIPASLIVTSFQAPLESTAIESGPIQTAQSRATQPLGSSNSVPTALFDDPSLLYSTTLNSLGETGHGVVSSPAHPFLPSTAVTGDSVNNSYRESSKQFPQFPFRHTELLTAPQSIGLAQSSTTTEPSTLSLRYDNSTLNGTGSQQDSVHAATGPELVDSCRHLGADQTAQDSCDLLHFEPMERPTETGQSLFLHDETFNSATSEDEHITSKDGEYGQLSILTQDTTQAGLSGLPDVLESEPDHSYLPQSLEQRQTSNKNGHSHDECTQEQSVTHHGGSARNVYSLDTIEDEDIDLRRDVDNSDSFRGERIQDDTPLINISLEHVNSLQPSLQEDVDAFSPMAAHISPPSSSHMSDHMFVPLYSGDQVTDHVSKVSPNQNRVMLEDEGVFPTSNATLPPTVSEIKADQSQAPVVTTGLSLQEAFLKRKKMFAQKSKHRLEEIKINQVEKRAQENTARNLISSFSHITSLESKSTPSPNSGHRNQSPGNKRIQPSKTVPDSRFGTGQTTAKKRVVTFSSPLLKAHDGHSESHTPRIPTDHLPTSAWLSAKERKKITRKEMSERNDRFYRRLPEVRKKMEEEKRKETEKINRDRAKCYQQKIRMKLKTQDRTAGQSPSQPVKPTVQSKAPFK